MNTDRQRIIEVYLYGGDLRRLSEVLGINIKAITGIIKIFITEGRILQTQEVV